MLFGLMMNNSCITDNNFSFYAFLSLSMEFLENGARQEYFKLLLIIYYLYLYQNLQECIDIK